MRNIFKGFHKRTAIGVTLSAGTGGTATYTNLPGESYTLASLPVGTEIVLDNGDYLIYYDGFPRGEIEATPSSGYKNGGMFVRRGGVDTTITSTPITLEDGDGIYVAFTEISYLCFTANTAGSTVKLNKNGAPTEVTLETSTDLSTWSTYTMGDTITLTNVGDKIYWRNTSETTTTFSGTYAANYYQFVMTGSVNGSGDITSLINKNLTTTIAGKYAFYKLFYNCSALKTPPTLPATTITDSCYGHMFGSSGITFAPALPATTLAYMCYSSMFQLCSSLRTPPALPATTLADRCYQNMFNSCTSLTTRPALPATTLTPYCYWAMFAFTSSANALPELPATTLKSNCYKGMFEGSREGAKLSTTKTGGYQTPYRIPSNGTGTDASDSMTSMFSSTSGTFTGTPTINTTYYTSNTVVPAS